MELTEPKRVTIVLNELSARFQTVTWPASEPITARSPLFEKEQAVNCLKQKQRL